MEQNEPEREDVFLTVSQAAEAAGVSYATALNWCHQHKIGRKVVGRWRVSRTALERLTGLRVRRPEGDRPKGPVRKGLLDAGA